MDLCPEARIGDYVLIHAGFAIQQLDQEEAEETIQLLKQLVEIR
jgi:hydrogenase expression/formation protein HypC